VFLTDSWSPVLEKACAAVHARLGDEHDVERLLVVGRACFAPRDLRVAADGHELEDD
jgi:hypothetical protein